MFIDFFMKNIIFAIIISLLVGISLAYIFGYFQAKRQIIQQQKAMSELVKKGILGEIEARGGFPLKFICFGLCKKFNIFNFIIDSAIFSVVVLVIVGLVLVIK